MFRKISIILPLIIFLISFSSCGSETGKNDGEISISTISDITHDNMNGHGNEVYISENDEYAPYYVIDDYNGGILLMRKELLPDTFQYYTASVYNSGAGYYPTSIPDDYLTNTFITFFSDEVQALIPETDIEIASLNTILRDDYTRTCETVSRKVFLLSAAEYGIRSSMASGEGKPIDCLEDYLTLDAQWLRSAYLWDDVHAWAISTEFYGEENVTSELYIRPVFVLPADTMIEISEDIAEGQSVYILSCEK